jgi:hypothetical protein
LELFVQLDQRQVRDIAGERSYPTPVATDLTGSCGHRA